ncbi:MAG: TonB family protein [Candidatus Eisenbacteria bacterium]
MISGIARGVVRLGGAGLIGLSLLGAIVQAASAETWLCPNCETRVERAPGAATLDCGECGSYTDEDLSWIVGYLNYKTRSAETSFLVSPEECDRFRQDGLAAFGENRESIWIPWIAVEYFIPRQRIVRLVDGREFTTDYARTRGEPCPAPPKFMFQIADTLRIAGQKERVVTQDLEEDISTLFVIAGTESGLRAGITRFIEEVEAGNHPRLPRTDNKVSRAVVPSIPASMKGKKLAHEVTVKVRSERTGQLLELQLVKGSGVSELDEAALRAAKATPLSTAGEMGVGVPSSVFLHYHYAGDTCTVDVEVPKNSIWEN